MRRLLISWKSKQTNYIRRIALVLILTIEHDMMHMLMQSKLSSRKRKSANTVISDATQMDNTKSVLHAVIMIARTGTLVWP